jgi:hypothetical protein
MRVGAPVRDAPPVVVAPPPVALPPTVSAPPPPRSHLTIKVGPVGADVALNGQRVGTDARLVERDLAPGVYTLEVQRDGYQKYTHDLWLATGEVRSEAVSLKKRRVWPTVVGVLVGAAATAAIVAVIVTQVGGSSSPSSASMAASGHGETAFSTETTR